MKIIFFLLICSLCAQSLLASEIRINGISLVASKSKLTQEKVDPILNIGANYSAIMPFGFVRHIDDPNVAYNSRRQWFGGRIEGAESYVQLLHRNNIKVMLKPQLWIAGGKYTGYVKMTSEQDWQTLEKTYTSFIIDYAKLAEQNDVEIFCIGTELEQFVVHRPQYWFNLIKKIKSVYKGKLTYAANWDEYKRTPFWREMDFIGVDGYFPVSTMHTPTIVSVKQGWQPWKQALKAFSHTYSKQILFTEWGYRSVDYAAKEPWQSDHSVETENPLAQANAIDGTFQELWQEDWFAGGFVWKWFIHHQQSGGLKNNRFTPQNKPAEDVIKRYFTVN